MAEPDLSRRRYFGGIVALLGVVFIWVTSSFAMNSIFGDLQYNKPFLVTYLNTATFSFYLIPFLFKQRRNKKKTSKKTLTASGQEQDSATAKLGSLETIKLSFAFCILWFFANYTTNASLAYTSVGSSTILASMSGLFTLGIGAMFNVERITLVKLISVCISFVGVILVSYSDQTTSDKVPTDNNNFSAALVGDILALSGAVFYGCYTTMLKVRIGDEDRIDMPLFFGFVGAFNVLLLWPLFPLLHWLGIETFQLPFNSTLWLMVLLNAFIGTFLSDYLWLLAMLMTSPLVVTLGISLTIPLALFGDIVFKHFVPELQYVIGALLVIVGFFSVNMSALNERKEDIDDQHQPLIPDPSISTHYHSV
ncbi:thiamine-repressible mitochondrial transport protein THI74 [Chlamydoabsidia padenii]|nr:thiamine-repressible mitochondrial transport protein THI74 [Chlamydoabsidia padenii]